MTHLFIYDKLTIGNRGGLNLMGLLFKIFPFRLRYAAFPGLHNDNRPCMLVMHTKADKHKKQRCHCGLD